MSMLNPLGRLARRDAPRSTLRERAAALKATAARVLQRRPADQPSPETLPPMSSVDRGFGTFPVSGVATDHSSQEFTGISSRDGAAAGRAPMEHAMGRHETFETGTPLADELLAGTALGHVAMPATPFDDPATVEWFRGGGLVPFPAVQPRAFVRTEIAIRLEAGLLLERARAEYARQYAAQIEPRHDAEWPTTLAGRLERALRIPELEAAARDPRPALDGTPDASDTTLVYEVSNAIRLRNELEAMHKGDSIEDPYDVLPAYRQKSDERDARHEIIIATDAEGMPGLQAKARLLLSLSDGLRSNYELQCEIGGSIANDLLCLRPAAVTERADPILAAIGENRRLLAAVQIARRLPLEGAEPPAELQDAMDALSEHRDSTLLGTVPKTAAGCLALARYAVEFARSEGVPLSREEGAADLLELMAECPQGPDLTFPGAIKNGPDPIQAVIAESRRLHAVNEALLDGAPGTPEDEASSAAFHALFGHWKDVVLKAKPTTAAGCSDLVRYVVEFADAHEFSDDEMAAAVRLLADGLTMARA